MRENKDKIPREFNSLEQIQDFWETHSTSDYWEEMEDVKMGLSSELKLKLELKKLYSLLKLSNDQIASIENKAKSESMDGKKLITKWILEHT